MPVNFSHHRVELHYAEDHGAGFYARHPVDVGFFVRHNDDAGKTIDLILDDESCILRLYPSNQSVKVSIENDDIWRVWLASTVDGVPKMANQNVLCGHLQIVVDPVSGNDESSQENRGRLIRDMINCFLASQKHDLHFTHVSRVDVIKPDNVVKFYYTFNALHNSPKDLMYFDRQPKRTDAVKDWMDGNSIPIAWNNRV